MRIAKAHAYGNDFVYVPAEDLDPDLGNLQGMARRLCDRHTGVGADGLIVFRETDAGAWMRLTNADGSPSEVSGNGVRGLAALLARSRGLRAGGRAPELLIETDAGPKRLGLEEDEGRRRFRFRAHMGVPERLRRVALEVAGESLEAGALEVGNPQCVVLAPLDEARLARIGPALQHHSEFPEGVNVELADVVTPERVRILIWERGVGPTLSSGTGSCASAIVASAYGGARRSVEVEAPGGAQRVEWTDDGIWLTGWAEVVFEGRWVG
jgi:diaminopimelate epimerase